MRALPLVLVVSGGLLAACLDEAPDESTGVYSVESHNRLGANRLGANRLGANRLGANRLGANGLIALNRESAEELLATDDGREVLSYIVSCALPDGMVLIDEDPEPGAPSEYFGALGLAPDWLDAPLDSVGKGWVSACLFARVNANAEAVPISLRGRHPELATTAQEELDYPVQEGAFYGNYFTPIEVPIAWFSCRGTGQAAGETGGVADRDCAEPSSDPNVSQCGFTYQGDCFGKHKACAQDRGGVYSHCDDDESGPAKQVITTYVAP